LAQRCEIQPQTARADRRQKASRLVADEHEERMRRWLLEDLEQRIGRFRVEVVGGVDDADATSPLARRAAEEGRCAAHVIDRYLGFEAFCLGIIAALERDEIGMAACGDAMRDR